jgi:uncharacterized protein (TIGR00255 family)
MITSMTGFASATHDAESATTSVTVKSVNHRFLDVQLRVPSTLAAAENALRTQIQQRLARGRVEVTVTVQTRRLTTPTVELDEAFAGRLGAAIERARELGVVSGTLQAGDLLRFPQALAVREAPVASPEDEAAQVKRGAETALAAALEALDTMRRREGELLRADLDARRGTLAAAIERVADAAEQGQGILRTRLHERIGDLGAGLALDAAAVAQEVVRFVARSDISEELVRFRAHLVHWNDLTGGPEPCGRKLDFLLQEMNREVNTIGSKSEGLQVSPIIVDMKAELERMREQVQNVE